MTLSPKRRKYYLSWQSSLLHFHTDVAHIRLQHQQLYKPILQTLPPIPSPTSTFAPF